MTINFFGSSIMATVALLPYSLWCGSNFGDNRSSLINNYGYMAPTAQSAEFSYSLSSTGSTNRPYKQAIVAAGRL